MKTAQTHLRKKQNLDQGLNEILAIKPNVVIAFGGVAWISDADFIKSLKQKLGNVPIVGCSTAGEIATAGLFENSMVLNAVHFDGADSRVQVYTETIGADQRATGVTLGKKINTENLAGLLILAPGLTVHNSELIHGMQSVVGDKAVISGGLAGDNGRFVKTAVFYDEKVTNDMICVVAFYGSSVNFHHSAKAGFRTFGNTRKISKAEGNVILEIDGQPALKVYKEALGKHAEELPQNGLMFPFAILNDSHDETGLMRAVKNIDEAAQSVHLFGDIATGSHIRLMRAENKGLISGAREAAENFKVKDEPNSLAILISCVGRKLVMGEAVEDELEAVSETLGSSQITGFCAYGEIGPFFTATDCQLHNQTMTITLLSEKSA